MTREKEWRWLNFASLAERLKTKRNKKKKKTEYERKRKKKKWGISPIRYDVISRTWSCERNFTSVCVCACVCLSKNVYRIARLAHTTRIIRKQSQKIQVSFRTKESILRDLVVIFVSFFCFALLCSFSLYCCFFIYFFPNREQYASVFCVRVCVVFVRVSRVYTCAWGRARM